MYNIYNIYLNCIRYFRNSGFMPKVGTMFSEYNGNQRECKRFSLVWLQLQKLPCTANGDGRNPPAVFTEQVAYTYKFSQNIYTTEKVFHMTLHYSSFYLTNCPENIIIMIILFLVVRLLQGVFITQYFFFFHLFMKRIHRKSELGLVLFSVKTSLLKTLFPDYFIYNIEICIILHTI